MKELMLLGAVMAGGSIGAGLRYASNLLALRLLGPSFPYGTLFVNVTGSFLMGLLFAAFASKLLQGEMTRLFLTTGMLGAFTTFSAFSLDFFNLIEKKAFFAAGSYMLASVGLSVAALILGYQLGKGIA